MGGNLIDFLGDKSIKVADIVMVKKLLNLVISTPGARAACINVKDFCLDNNLPEPEYIWFNQDSIPTKFWEQYNLDNYVDDRGRVHAIVLKGMFGLTQAGRVAYDHLVPQLDKNGFRLTGIVPRLFKYGTNSIIVTLIVDDFFVLLTDIQDMQLLETTLRKWYTITVDMNAVKYCGLTMD